MAEMGAGVGFESVRPQAVPAELRVVTQYEPQKLLKGPRYEAHSSILYLIIMVPRVLTMQARKKR